MARKTTHIKVTQPAFPFGLDYIPNNAQPVIEERGPSEGEVLPITLENVLPQPYGYASFFGKNKLALPPLDWGVQDMFVYRTASGDNVMVALGYKGALFSNDGLTWNTSQAFIRSGITLVDNLGNNIGTVQQSNFEQVIASTLGAPVGLTVDALPTSVHSALTPEIREVLFSAQPTATYKIPLELYFTLNQIAEFSYSWVNGYGSAFYSTAGITTADTYTVAAIYVDPATNLVYEPKVLENLAVNDLSTNGNKSYTWEIPIITGTVIVGDVYHLTALPYVQGSVNLRDVTYTAVAGDTITTVLTALVAAANAAWVGLTYTVTLNADNSISIVSLNEPFAMQSAGTSMGSAYVWAGAPTTLVATGNLLETISLPPVLNRNATYTDSTVVKPLDAKGADWIAVKVTGVIPDVNNTNNHPIILVDGHATILGTADANGFYYIPAPKRDIGLAYYADDVSMGTTSIDVYSVTGEAVVSGIASSKISIPATSAVGAKTLQQVQFLQVPPNTDMYLFAVPDRGALKLKAADADWDYYGVTSNGTGSVQNIILDLVSDPIVTAGVRNIMAHVKTLVSALAKAPATKLYTIGPFSQEADVVSSSTNTITAAISLPSASYLAGMPLTGGVSDYDTSVSVTLNAVAPDGSVVTVTGNSKFLLGSHYVRLSLNLTALDTTSYTTVDVWTKAIIRNRLYVYRQGLGVILRLADDGLSWERLQPTFANMEFIRGISSAKGRLVMWDSDNSVYRSSVSDPTDFTPSLATQANVEKVDALRGRIITILPLGDDFIIYASSSIIHAQFVGGTFVYKYEAISNKTGILNAEAVTEATPQSHFAWVQQGLVSVSAGSMVDVSAEASDYLKNTDLPVSLRFIQNRYLSLSMAPTDSSFLTKRTIATPASTYLPALYLPPIPEKTRRIMLDLGMDITPDAGTWNVVLQIPSLHGLHNTLGTMDELVNFSTQGDTYTFDHIEVFYTPIIQHNHPVYFALLQLVIWDRFFLEYDRWSNQEFWPSPAYLNAVSRAFIREQDFRFATMLYHYIDRNANPVYDTWGSMFMNWQWFAGEQLAFPVQEFFDFFAVDITNLTTPNDQTLSINEANKDLTLEQRSMILQESPYTTTGYDIPAVVLPAGSFLGLEGSNAPLYPTYSRALLLDTKLKNWGSCDNLFKLLVDYSPINERSVNPILGETRTKFTYENFGTAFALLDPEGQLHLCDDAPDTSLVEFGKVGYTRTGITRALTVAAGLVDARETTLEVRGSLDGQQFDPRVGGSETNSLGNIILNKVMAAKWFTILTRGKFKLKSLEFTGEIGGQR